MRLNSKPYPTGVGGMQCIPFRGCHRSGDYQVTMVSLASYIRSQWINITSPEGPFVATAAVRLVCVVETQKENSRTTTDIALLSRSYGLKMEH